MNRLTGQQDEEILERYHAVMIELGLNSHESLMSAKIHLEVMKLILALPTEENRRHLVLRSVVATLAILANEG